MRRRWWEIEYFKSVATGRANIFRLWPRSFAFCRLTKYSFDSLRVLCRCRLARQTRQTLVSSQFIISKLDPCLNTNLVCVQHIRGVWTGASLPPFPAPSDPAPCPLHLRPFHPFSPPLKSPCPRPPCPPLYPRSPPLPLPFPAPSTPAHRPFYTRSPPPQPPYPRPPCPPPHMHKVTPEPELTQSQLKIFNCNDSKYGNIRRS